MCASERSRPLTIARVCALSNRRVLAIWISLDKRARASGITAPVRLFPDRAAVPSPASPLSITNRLIASLTRKDRVRLLEACEPVVLSFGDRLCEPGDAFRHVHFPLTGFISLVAAVDQHAPLEMGLIGNEGMLGASLILDVDAVPLGAVVQGSGSALRLGVARFRRELGHAPGLQRVLKRYLYVLMSQLSQTAACNRFHSVEARLARWLLMTHDRAPADNFHLTHEFLSEMIGVRRSGITIAAGALQQHGAIRYSRGDIEILDRAVLESQACQCYANSSADYERVLGRRGARR